MVDPFSHVRRCPGLRQAELVPGTAWARHADRDGRIKGHELRALNGTTVGQHGIGGFGMSIVSGIWHRPDGTDLPLYGCGGGGRRARGPPARHQQRLVRPLRLPI